MFLSNTSVCNGCAFGKRISCGVFCGKIKELVPIEYKGCKAQDDFYEKMYQEEKRMTLTELAHKLREIFKFDILTYSAWEDGDCYVTEQLDEIILWYRRVLDALPEYDDTANNFYGGAEIIALLNISSMSAMISEALDLSEYKDENGKIDYSKCIVEVE